MKTIGEFPSFYSPGHAGSWSYQPDVLAVRAEAEQWQTRHKLTPATDDARQIELLAIDCQKDFCLPDGALFVAGRSGRGAIDDTRRIVEFIYRNLANLTRITLTLDSHFALQIFFDSFWRDARGDRPAPFTQITADDIRSHRWQLDPAAAQFSLAGAEQEASDWAARQALYYADQLDRSGKYSLTVWPYHCLVGDSGHALVGAIQEARLFHSAARAVQSEVEIKGSNPWTEHYSVFGAEVRQRWDGQPLGTKNLDLVLRLLRNDAVILVGQAASHCFMWSVDDLLQEVRRLDERLIRKVYLVRDCTSPVVVTASDGTPLVDFTEATEAAFRRWSSEGVNIVDSVTDLAHWPGFDRRGPAH